MDVLSIFAERFCDLLIDNRIEILDFSNQTKINLSLLYKYRNAEVFPSTCNAVKIAGFFHCSLDYLFGFENDYSYTVYKSYEKFTERFKKLLSDAGYSRYRFYKETNFAKQTISDWYDGKALPHISNLIYLSKFFKTSLEYILGNKD